MYFDCVQISQTKSFLTAQMLNLHETFLLAECFLKM